MSTTAVGGTLAASACRLNPRIRLSTFADTARTTATSPTYSAPAISQASSGTGPHEFGAEE
jgi:hypothetical protein